LIPILDDTIHHLLMKKNIKKYWIISSVISLFFLAMLVFIFILSLPNSN